MKRLWMLLLVVVALTVVLATPAMAADEGTLSYCLCGDADGHEETVNGCDGTVLKWTPLDTNWTENTTLSGGNYYLTDNASTRFQLYFENGSVARLDLNGFTLTDGASRLFSLNGANVPSEFWITDTSEAGTGTIKMEYDTATTVYTGEGAVIWLNKASTTVNLIAGTLDASRISISNKNGGAAVTVSNGTFNMYGGTILGGTHQPTAKPNAFGGAVSVLSAGTFNLCGGAIEGGNAVSCTVDGETTTAQGGAIYSVGTLNISGGTVSGGLVDATKSIDNGNAVFTGGQSSNIYATGNVTISGGTINGFVDVSGATSVSISGDPVILAVDADGKAVSGATNLNIGSLDIAIGEMTTGASVGITANEEGTFTSGASEAYADYFHADDAVTTDGDDSQGVAYVSVDGELWLGHYDCLCAGAGENGTCVGTAGGCTSSNLLWMPWSSTSNSQKLPTTTGNWYLTEGFETSGISTAAANATINLNLNGKTVTSAPAEDRRFYNVNAAGISITVTDGYYDGKNTVGTLQNHATGYSQGGIVLLNNNGQFTLIAGTLDCENYNGYRPSADSKEYNGTVISGAKNSVFTMYGGTVKGGSAYKEGGTIWSAGTINIHGGTISGGRTKVYGGNIYSSGTLNITGGTISGGKLAEISTDENGNTITKTYNEGTSDEDVIPVLEVVGDDNIYATGTVTISGGTINGFVDVSGAASVSISGAPQITGGTTNLNIGSNTLTIGEMTGGNIGITASVEGVFGAPADGVALTSAYAGYFSADNRDKGVAYAEISTTALETYGGFLWFGHYDCLCAKAGTDAQGNAACVGGDACDGEEDLVWIPWDTDILNTYSTHYAGGVVTVPLSSGNWYLTDNITVTRNSPIRASAVVNLDLNGKTIATGGSKAYRVFQMNNSTNAKVSITDGDDGDTAATGSIVHTGKHDQGGILWLAKAGVQVTLIAGKLDGSGFTTRNMNAEGGSAVSVESNTASFAMYGGEIVGGTAIRGAAVAISSGQFEMYGGTITGGTATYMTYYSNTANTTFKGVLGGTGGAVYVGANGTMTISGGTVTGGTATAAAATDPTGATVYGGGQGGTIYSEGTLTISGGNITGGTVESLTVDSTTYGGQGANIYATGTVTISGGTINGYVDVSGATTVNISGDSTIQAVDEDGNAITGATNLNVGANNLTVGTMTGGHIGITTTDAASAPVFGVAGEALGTIPYAYKAYFSSDEGYVVIKTADGLELANTTSTHIHCACGALIGDGVKLSDGSTHYCSDVVYTALNDASTMASGGAYYLSDALNGSVEVSDDLYLCLNGKTWTAGESARTLTATGCAVTISDCAYTAHVADANGNVTTASAGGSIVGNAVQNEVELGGTISVTAGGTLNLYGGMIIGGAAKYGGNVYLNASAMNIYGGTVAAGDSNFKYESTAGQGGNIYFTGSSTVTMYGGLVSGGASLGNGGSIRVNGGSATIVMYGGLVTGGEAGNQGGNIMSTGSIKLYGGMVANGLAKSGGGNVCVNSTATTTLDGVTVAGGRCGTVSNGTYTAGSSGGNLYFCPNSANTATAKLTVTGATVIRNGQAVTGGNIAAAPNTYNSKAPVIVVNISGGSIYGGEATNGANLHAKTAADCSTTVNITGGSISGYVYMDENVEVVLAGAPTVYAEGAAYNLDLDTNTLTVGETLSKDANVVISCAEPESGYSGYEVAIDIPENADTAGITYQDGEYVVYRDGEKLILLQPGATLNGSTTAVYTLQDAINKAAGTANYVTLLCDYSSDVALTADGDLYLDLNGCTITADLQVNGTLYLFDSATSDYSTAEDNGKTYGKIVGTVEGTVSRAFTTSPIKANYDNHNYRYLVIKDVVTDGETGIETVSYHSHRIYLAVKSTVLYPSRPAVNYRTVLRCDEVVITYINDGGAYGAKVIGYEGEKVLNSDGAYGTYTEKVGAWSGSNDNSRIAQLGNIISTDMELVEQQRRTEDVTLHASAYIKIADDFGQDEITSSAVKKSMKEVVQAADAMTDLTATQKALLGVLYKTYSALFGPTSGENGAGNAWQLNKIPGYAEDYTTGLVYRCACGDSSSENNPCAAKNHAAIVWQPWYGTDSLPTDGGNYYLTDNVALTEAAAVSDFVCIDLAGCSITSTAGVAEVGSGAILNLVNSGEANTVSGTGEGGALKIADGGNVSLYTGVTLTGSDGSVVVTDGDMNIYGGTVDATGVTAENGSAIYVGEKGYLFINQGQIKGGAATNGGAVYSLGDVELDGSAAISGGTATNGGNIYIAGGEMDLAGSATVSGGVTTEGGFGGNIYAAGTVYITGGTVSGGNALLGGNIYIASEKVMMTGGIITEGVVSTERDTDTYRTRGGNIYIKSGASMTMEAGRIEKGQALGNKASTSAGGWGGNIECCGTLTIADGTVSQGQAFKNGGNIRLDGGNAKLIMSGGTVENGRSSDNGGNIHCGSGTMDISGGTITGGEAPNGGNITINSKKTDITIKNVTITNGKATTGNGGNFRVFASAAGVELENVTITGGQATKNGGNVYMESGSIVTVSNSTISGGCAAVCGGNIYLTSEDTSVTLSGSTVSSGVAGTKGEDSSYSFTSSQLGGNIYLANAEANLTVNSGTVEDGQAYNGGNIYSLGHIEISGGTVSDGTAVTSGGNIYTTGDLTISGTGTVTEVDGEEVTTWSTLISGGTATVSGGSIYTTGSLSMTGGKVTGGAVDSDTPARAYGGNIYATGTVTVSGGLISDGSVYKDRSYSDGETYGDYYSYGGNIYAIGSLTVSGSAEITGGYVGGYVKRAWGGNIYIEETGSLTMEGGTVSKGYTPYNSGNIHIDNGAEFEMTGGYIQDGEAGNCAGNLYVGNTTVYISGGEITGGQAKDGAEDDTANMYVVSGNLVLSGGYIDGGVNIYAYGYASSLTLSGAPTVDRTGIKLANYKNGKTDESGNALYYDITVDASGLTKDASVVIYYTTFAGNGDNGLQLVAKDESMTWSAWEEIARESLLDYSGNASSEVTYEEGGIYLRKGTENRQKWTCSCGANYGDIHMVGCDHYDVQWNEWTGDNLPTEEGYWYLSRSSTKTDASGKAYVTVSQTSIPYDYATVNATGERIRVRTILAQDTSGSTMTDDDGRYVTVAEYLENNPSLSYADEVGATLYTEASYAYEGVDGTLYKLSELTLDTDGYEIHVDLNGYALESGIQSRVYNLNVNTGSSGVREMTVNGTTYTYWADRTTPLTITVVDSSQDHIGSISAYGVHSDGYRLSGTQYQGAIIWMPKKYDTMNLSFVELDASSVYMGSGLAIYTGGTMNLHYTDIVGGISQGSIMESNNTLTSAVAGGGAIYIGSTGFVTMTGGSIKNGTAIYRYMSGMEGITGLSGDPAYYDRSVGGGNVYLNGGTFIVDGGEISGGKALIYTGDTKTNPAPYYSYGSGGGIYVASGELIVKGNTKIYDNFTGTVSGSLYTADHALNFYDAVDVENAQIFTSGQDNIYLGGEIMTLQGLGNDAKVGFLVNTLDGSTYEGTFAYADADYITSGKLICDDGSVSGAVYDATEGKIYVAKGDSSTYLVGYGIADIQPELKDLQNGVIMTNYGNDRDTSELYKLDGYYDITRDSEENYGKNYFGGWDTKLYVTALATTDGEGDTVIIISADSSTFDSSIANHAKRMVSAATGVPMDNITISCEHQHSAPNASIKYYEDGSVKTNYAATFYNGVVAAAVEAMKDRQQASVSTSVLDTTSGGKQYNFVRNVKLAYSGGSGMLTDNHMTLYYASSQGVWVKPGASSDSQLDAAWNGLLLRDVTLSYESEVDTTMQLVQYTQADGDVIVMTNFQTHPHLGSNGSSRYVHSDVVGSFRYYLEKALESGTETDYKVMYFSGAGGNVNTTTSIDGDYNDQDDSVLYPYTDSDLDADADVLGTNSLKVLQKSDLWGQSLASLTAEHLQNTGNLTAVSGSNDVEVSVQTFEGTRKTSDASEKAVAKIAGEGGLLNWSDGSYQDVYVNVGGSYETWWKYVGYSTNETDQVYSCFDARRIRYCLLWAEAGKTKLEMDVTAYAMGEIGFVAAPYEMFQENGQEIKNGASGTYAMTIVATQANGGNGYIPSAAGYANGGYSTDSTSFVAGTGEQLATKFVEMLKDLKN